VAERRGVRRIPIGGSTREPAQQSLQPRGINRERSALQQRHLRRGRPGRNDPIGAAQRLGPGRIVELGSDLCQQAQPGSPLGSLPLENG
jgi:hypothetical protein